MEIVWHKQDNGVDLRLKTYKSLCATECFVINGVEADLSDFGALKDMAPNPDEPYCCGDMRFVPCLPTREATRKYGISAENFERISEVLKGALSFGKCCYCE